MLLEGENPIRNIFIWNWNIWISKLFWSFLTLVNMLKKYAACIELFVKTWMRIRLLISHLTIFSFLFLFCAKPCLVRKYKSTQLMWEIRLSFIVRGMDIYLITIYNIQYMINTLTNTKKMLPFVFQLLFFNLTYKNICCTISKH